ncbi:transmembrane protein [Achlya hypogyna]|uniref:Transmembrane protein n=1 Tax=Achlya hypogyna TaxID=1202772 RepID=A0A1V9ZDZ8_ACHHY|nr:transmembrane protein [Achlya hypogyna]
MLRQFSRAQEKAVGRLRINVGQRRVVAAEAQSLRSFKTSAELGMRCGVGVVLASLFLAKADAPRLWVCFPEWYILGGISFIAASCVISAGRNIGQTLCQMFQQKLGVMLAFAFNAVLFSIFQPRLFTSKAQVDAAIADGTLLRITESFSGKPYFVNNRDLFTVLPFTFAFNAFILVMPFAANTRKFALVNNALFALTVVSPNSYNNASQLKDAASGLYDSPVIVRNLLIYMCLGLIGVVLAFVIVWLPYPLLYFATRHLQAALLASVPPLEDALHLMVDAYCFKKKDVDHLHFHRVKLKRQLDLASAKKNAMLALLDDAWWEQCLGLDAALGFKKTVAKAYVELYAALLRTLHAMSQALHLEQYNRLHGAFVHALQHDIGAVQGQAMALLREITDQVHEARIDVELTLAAPLQAQLMTLLAKLKTAQTDIFATVQPTAADVQGNMPLHLFIFSLQALCATMVEFPDKLRRKNHNTSTRTLHFVRRSLKEFVDPASFTRSRLQTAARVWLALLLANLLSVYVFGYSPTIATTIGYIMGTQLGGSFGISFFRAVGVVAGVIVPSIVLFFICAFGTSNTVIVVLRDVYLFLWTASSMYVKWQGGLDAYAGLVSAFLAAGILLPDTTCPAPGSLAPYAAVVQAMLAVLLVVGVELFVWPESAYVLLRKNVQQHLRLCQEAFATLFEHTLRAEGGMEPEALADVRAIIEKKAPALLAQQSLLLGQAVFEPKFWRPPFAKAQYAQVVQSCERLLASATLLYKVVGWFQLHRSPPLDAAAHEVWAFSSSTLSAAIHDAFETLHALFGIQFRYAEPDQTALFAQIKEAFRSADRSGTGVLDASDVERLLVHVFEASGTLPGDTIDHYVKDFIAVVDRRHTGKVALADFMAALENGLLLEVEVLPQVKLRRRRSSSVCGVDASPLLSPLARLSSVQEDAAGEGAIYRAYDLLDAESCSLLDAAEGMRQSFAVWLLEGQRYKSVPVEELLLLTSLICGVGGIAENLTTLEETTIQS